MKIYGLVMMGATELVVSVVLFLYLGRWADSKFGTGSLFLGIGAAAGFIIGMVQFIYRLKSFERQATDNSNENPDENSEK